MIGLPPIIAPTRVSNPSVAVGQPGACRSGENAEPREGVQRAFATSSRPNARREPGLDDAPGSCATATPVTSPRVLPAARSRRPLGHWRSRERARRARDAPSLLGVAPKPGSRSSAAARPSHSAWNCARRLGDGAAAETVARSEAFQSRVQRHERRARRATESFPQPARRQCALDADHEQGWMLTCEAPEDETRLDEVRRGIVGLGQRRHGGAQQIEGARAEYGPGARPLRTSPAY